MNPFCKSILILVFALLLPTLAMAEDAVRSQEATWNETADRAARTIVAGAASNSALEVLRAELAGQRAEAFQIIQKGNLSVQVLQAELDGLGPAPKEGETEPLAAATRRQELAEAVAVASEPIISARQTYNRADVLIREIDRMIRTAMRRDLFERSPSALVPTRWWTAATELYAYGQRVFDEVQKIMDAPTTGVVVRQGLPGAAAMLVAGLLGLFVLQPWFTHRMDLAAQKSEDSKRRNRVETVSMIMRPVVPTLAAILLVAAIYALHIAPFSARTTLMNLPLLPVFIILPYWLAHLLFAPGMPQFRAVTMDDRHARQAVRACLALGIILIFDVLLEGIEADHAFSPEAKSVLESLPVLVSAAWIWRLSSIFLQSVSGNPSNATPDTDSTTREVTILASRFMQLAVVAALLSVGLGYVQLARTAVEPTILSLIVIGFGITLSRAVVGILGLLLRSAKTSAVMALLPLVVGFVVIILILPVFAMIWGARAADLSDVWVLITEGVVVGNTRLSFTIVASLVLTFVVGLVVTRWLRRLLAVSVLPKTGMDTGGRTALTTGFSYLGIILSGLFAVAVAGIDLSSLAIVIGALSFGIGFGLQAVTSNFISGIILLIERPIKEGDWIEVSGHSGIVRKISVRSTRIETFDRHDIIVPNSDLMTGTVKNMTLSTRSGRLILPISVAYGSDLETTKTILLEAAANHKGIETFPEPVVLFISLGDSALNFELRCYITDALEVLSVRSDLLFATYAALKRHNIEIPFPQRDLTLRNLPELAELLAKAGKETQ